MAVEMAVMETIVEAVMETIVEAATRPTAMPIAAVPGSVMNAIKRMPVTIGHCCMGAHSGCRGSVAPTMGSAGSVA
jgi:hypothetical protein